MTVLDTYSAEKNREPEKYIYGRKESHPQSYHASRPTIYVLRYTIFWLKKNLGDGGLLLNAFTTGTLLGTNLLEVSIGGDFGVLKGLAQNRRHFIRSYFSI